MRVLVSRPLHAYPRRMPSNTLLARGIALILLAMVPPTAFAASKVHTVVFGRWTIVPWVAGNEDTKPLSIKVRPLIVDGRVKEYAIGMPHEITERLFVVRRAFRVNDSLPDESGTPRWQWQRGGWLLVDRLTGHVSPLNLPEFDVFYSSTSWYRDYAAYRGVSDDGKKIYAIVAQVGRRKPVLKKALGDATLQDSTPDSACSTPEWQRFPARVSFEIGKDRQTFAIRGHVVDMVSDEDDDDAE